MTRPIGKSPARVRTLKYQPNVEPAPLIEVGNEDDSLLPGGVTPGKPSPMARSRTVAPSPFKNFGPRTLPSIKEDHLHSDDHQESSDDHDSITLPSVTQEPPIGNTKKKKKTGFNLRKSLAWNNAFLQKKKPVTHVDSKPHTSPMGKSSSRRGDANTAIAKGFAGNKYQSALSRIQHGSTKMDTNFPGNIAQSHEHHRSPSKVGSPFSVNRNPQLSNVQSITNTISSASKKMKDRIGMVLSGLSLGSPRGAPPMIPKDDSVVPMHSTLNTDVSENVKLTRCYSHMSNERFSLSSSPSLVKNNNDSTGTTTIIFSNLEHKGNASNACQEQTITLNHGIISSCQEVQQHAPINPPNTETSGSNSFLSRAKPSGLRMPSSKFGFFEKPKAHNLSQLGAHHNPPSQNVGIPQNISRQSDLKSGTNDHGNFPSTNGKIVVGAHASVAQNGKFSSSLPLEWNASNSSHISQQVSRHSDEKRCSIEHGDTPASSNKITSLDVQQNGKSFTGNSSHLSQQQISRHSDEKRCSIERGDISVSNIKMTTLDIQQNGKSFAGNSGHLSQQQVSHHSDEKRCPIERGHTPASNNKITAFDSQQNGKAFAGNSSHLSQQQVSRHSDEKRCSIERGDIPASNNKITAFDVHQNGKSFAGCGSPSSDSNTSFINHLSHRADVRQRDLKVATNDHLDIAGFNNKQPAGGGCNVAPQNVRSLPNSRSASPDNNSSLNGYSKPTLLKPPASISTKSNVHLKSASSVNGSSLTSRLPAPPTSSQPSLSKNNVVSSKNHTLPAASGSMVMQKPSSHAKATEKGGTLVNPLQSAADVTDGKFLDAKSDDKIVQKSSQVKSDAKVGQTSVHTKAEDKDKSPAVSNVLQVKKNALNIPPGTKKNSIPRLIVPPRNASGQENECRPQNVESSKSTAENTTHSDDNAPGYEEWPTQKTGAVQHSPKNKEAPPPGPWSPIKRNGQQIGPFDCTKYTNVTIAH